MLDKLNLKSLLKIKYSSKLRTIIANIGWLFADRILRMGFGLIVGVWIARYLGVKQFGLLNYASAFVALFSPLATLGLDGIVIKEIVRDPSHQEEILGTTFWLKFIGAITCLLLTVACIFGFRHNDTLTVSLVAILAVAGIFQAFDTIDLWFQSQVQSKYTVIAKNTAFVAVTMLKVALLTMKAPLIAFAWATLAEFAVGAVGLVIAYRVKGFSMWRWRWNFLMAKAFLKESVYLVFSAFALMIYQKIDQIMLAEMLDEYAVGIYSSAVRISEVIYFIPGIIIPSVSSVLFAAKQKSEFLYYQLLEQMVRLILISAIILSIPLALLSEKIVLILFGNDYAAAGAILAIHIWTSLFVFMGSVTALWFIAEGLTIFSFYRTLLGAVVNVLLNLLLIPVYAGVGAAIATIISFALAVFLMNAIHPKTRKLFLIQMKAFLLFK